MEGVTDLAAMLTLQLSELEMLQSMFPDPGEVELDDPTAPDAIRSFVDGQIPYSELQSRLRILVRLPIGPDKVALELVCMLPHEYPQQSPEVFLRCPSLARHQHRLVNEQLQAFLEPQERGELCVYAIIQWLQEHVEQYLTTSAEQETNPVPAKEDLLFSRMWVYSHHIYSKIKRKDILSISEELNLTGFCMPGKPGIICIEGFTCNVEDFWQRIRRMQWKKLAMKHREDCTVLPGQSIDGCRIFGKLEEKHFEPRHAKGRGAHQDRGLLYQFLEQHGCGAVFAFYFGLDGTSADPQSD